MPFVNVASSVLASGTPAKPVSFLAWPTMGVSPKTKVQSSTSYVGGVTPYWSYKLNSELELMLNCRFTGPTKP